MRKNWKIGVLLLALTLLIGLTVFVATASVDVEPGSLCDVNGDGKISASDARLALRYAVNIDTTFTQEQKTAADINQDGMIKVADARGILRVAVNIDKHPSENNTNQQATSSEYGNTHSNIMNGGRVVSDGTYHYYSLSDGIYKWKIGSSSHEKLTSSGAFATALNMHNNEIYFNDENGISKIGIDGKNYTRITKSRDIQLRIIYNGELYGYSETYASGKSRFNIFRLALNGVQLKYYPVNDMDANTFLVYDGYIYCAKVTNEDYPPLYSIHKINIDTGNSSVVVNNIKWQSANFAFPFTIAQGNIYYPHINNSNAWPPDVNLIKIKLDGTGKANAMTGISYADEDGVFYVNVTPDGKIYNSYDENVNPVFVADGWKYYITGVSDWLIAERSKIDDTNYKLLEEKYATEDGYVDVDR